MTEGLRTVMTILISPSDVESLSNELARFGARSLAWPELTIDAPKTYFALDETIENLFGYDWLVLKNETAAAAFLLRFQTNHGLDELDDLKTLAIGESTIETLLRSHIHLDLAIERFPAEDIFASLQGYEGGLSGRSFLLPSAGVTSELFEEQLAEAGARVDNVSAYRTTSEKQRLAQLLALLAGGGVDCVIFMSSSVLREFGRLVDSHDLRRVLSGVAVVCGNAETARTAEEYGLKEPKMMPARLSDATLAALVRANPQ